VAKKILLEGLPPPVSVVGKDFLLGLRGYKPLPQHAICRKGFLPSDFGVTNPSHKIKADG
jgi:hypothetical protein